MEAKAVDLLLQYGLTRQEAKIYLLLITDGPLSGYEAAKRSGISRSNTYASLSILVEKGAAYIIEEQTVQYQAVSIEEFCQNHIYHMQQAAKELKELLPVNKNRPENYITIRSRRNVEDKIRQMLGQVEKRVYLSVSSKILDLYKEDLQELVAEGKKVVLITDVDYDLEGATLYHTPDIDMQIRLITDSEKALTGEMADRWQMTCLYSENPNLVKLLKEALANEIKLIQIKATQDMYSKKP